MKLDALLAILAEYQNRDDSDCESLPPDAYLSPDLHRHEFERIFRREWLCVGREEHVAEPGDYYCIDFLGDPLVIVRDDEGQIRALSSVCRHRYMPVVTGAGRTSRFVCPYHAWTYATDGRLVAAPHMKGSKRFREDRCRLPEYRLESWCGFLFANLDDDAEPLVPRMKTLEQHIENYRVGQQVEIMRYESEWVGNWKLSAENSMEYYHHVGLHKTTVGKQLPARNTYLPPAPADLSFTHARCAIDEAFKTTGHPFNARGRLDSFTKEELETGYMVYVFPAFTMAMRPNANNWLSFRPDGPENTKVLGGYLVSPEVRAEFPDLAEERRELILRVNEEDSRATTELAKVMRSSRAARGPLSPFEATIAQFYRYLARTLAGASRRRTPRRDHGR